MTKHGYVNKGDTMEHRWLAARALGKPLPQGVQVHHFNHIRHDNDGRNLVICQDAAYHSLLHRRERVLRAGGDPNCDHLCTFCRRLVTPEDKPKILGRRVWCRACKRRMKNLNRQRKRDRGLTWREIA